jgi:hypothetical protein
MSDENERLLRTVEQELHAITIALREQQEQLLTLSKIVRRVERVTIDIAAKLDA